MATEWQTPNEVLRKAEETMLDGRKAESVHDWIMVLNCIAFNLDIQIVEPALVLFKTMYDIPLPEDEVRDIARFQVGKRTGISPN